MARAPPPSAPATDRIAAADPPARTEERGAARLRDPGHQNLAIENAVCRLSLGSGLLEADSPWAWSFPGLSGSGRGSANARSDRRSAPWVVWPRVRK